MSQRVFEDGAILCRAGDPAQAIFRVREGALRVEPAGDGPNTYVLAPGGTFGAEALLAGAGYGATARAIGRTVVDRADGEAVRSALAAQPEILRRLIDAAFGAPCIETTPPDRIGLALRLMPAGPAVAEQTGREGVLVSAFPFVVGRKEAHWEENGARGVDLVLRDRPPYNLSRRHFAIEREGAQYVVRDCGSYHGTIVNGAVIGAKSTGRSAPLHSGENEIVAGTANSPIRFSFLVG